MPSLPCQTILLPVHQALANGTANQKGASLEAAMRLILEPIPGIWRIDLNTTDVFDAEEVDLGVGNLQAPDGVPFLPDVFLVECKNWSKPVGALEVTSFIAKLEERAMTFGLLVAANGITGDPNQRTSANERIAAALKEGRRIIVVRLTDLEAVTTTEAFVNLLRVRIMDLTLKRGVF